MSVEFIYYNGETIREYFRIMYPSVSIKIDKILLIRSPVPVIMVLNFYFFFRKVFHECIFNIYYIDPLFF